MLTDFWIPNVLSEHIGDDALIEITTDEKRIGHYQCVKQQAA
jgi:hypothetical protein